MTFLIRAYGGFPEGVCYAILFMNCVSPLIERYAGAAQVRRRGREGREAAAGAATAKGAAK